MVDPWTPPEVTSLAPECTVGGDILGDRQTPHLAPLASEERDERMEGEVGVSGASSPPPGMNSKPDQRGSLGSFQDQRLEGCRGSHLPCLSLCTEGGWILGNLWVNFIRW